MVTDEGTRSGLGIRVGGIRCIRARARLGRPNRLSLQTRQLEGYCRADPCVVLYQSNICLSVLRHDSNRNQSPDFTLCTNKRRNRRTELQSGAACQFPDTLQQPRRHLLAPLVDTLLNALAYGLLDGLLYLFAASGVLGRDGHCEEGCEGMGQGEARICHLQHV